MPLQLRKTRPPAERVPAVGPDDPTSSPYTSQAFSLWDEQTRSSGKRHILEMSSAHPENLRFFGEEPCRLEVVALDRVLPLAVETSEDEEDPAEREIELLRAHLPSLGESSQHGALVWDLLNYMSRSQFGAYGEWLHTALKLDGLVHVVLYTGSTMWPKPSEFHVLANDRLERRDRGPERVACPEISQGSLKRDWPGFEVVRSFLLRNESQEFVLRRL